MTLKLKVIFTALSLLITYSNNLIAQSSIKVFILAGQSNMEGAGLVYDTTKAGTLEHFLKWDNTKEYQDLIDQQGNFISRNDVWIRYNRGDNNPILLKDDWNINFGAWNNYIGPEYGFGRQLGNYYNDQVLIIKTAWGGKSLAVDFRPPSSGGATGPYYTRMLSEIQTAINNIATEFPNYTGIPIEIVGFSWFQGWNDGGDAAYRKEYEANMINFIKDIRSDLNEPDMKFVIANSGHGGLLPYPDTWTRNIQDEIVPAQAAAANHTGYKGVALSDTRGFWRDPNASPSPRSIHHFCDNAETFLKIGNDIGIKMIELIEKDITSVNETSKNSINIFPNPASSRLSISGDNLSIAKIDILDINGKNIKTITKYINGINVADLKAGVYFIRILSNQETLTQKLLIFHASP